MRRAVARILSIVVLSMLVGCRSSPARGTPGSRELTWGDRCVRFIQPSTLAGRAEYVSSNLRISLLDRGSTPQSLASVPPNVVTLVVESRRDSLGHIDSWSSCLIDPEAGATNLLPADRILPPRGKVLLGNPIPASAPAGFSFKMEKPGVLVMTSEPPAIGTTQRILLGINWEDGTKEDVDLTYEVVAKHSASAS